MMAKAPALNYTNLDADIFSDIYKLRNLGTGHSASSNANMSHDWECDLFPCFLSFQNSRIVDILT